MSAHTPGPWTDESGDGSKWGVFDADGRAVALAQQIVSLRVDVYQAERTANARLIAAAPDLLKHLRELVEIVDAAISAGDWKVDGCCDPSLSLDWARAAIAKAEGRA
jgi:hypothetical protein